MLFAQVTDTHITVDGRQSRDLQGVLTWIEALVPRPEAILLSGDLTDGGRPEQYARLRALLASCTLPVLVVPGNHDRRDALRPALPKHLYPGASGEHLSYAVDIGGVRVIGLDTTDSGRPGGILDEARLSQFAGMLDAVPGRPVFIFMHHPPFRTGVNLADLFGFAGLRRFRRIVAAHPQVRRIVAGHIHCERAATIAQAYVTTSLSSTPQAVPEVFERRLFGLRPEPAGFALHTWAREAFTSTTYVAAGDGTFIKR